MYRVRSTDVWFNAPGIVTAYQPVAAPDALLALQNVGNNLRMAGKNTARPNATSPTWRSSSGWSNLSNYLVTDCYLPKNKFTIIARQISLGSLVFGPIVFATATGYVVELTTQNTTSNKRRYQKGGTYDAATNGPASCVMAIAGDSGYLDGALEVASIGTNFGSSVGQLQVGASPTGAGVAVAAVVAISTILSPAHVMQYSRQMAYCNVNSDWSAWGRRRQYFYAPSAAAAFQSAWARNANSVIQANR